jgi:hypothetical protein
VSNIKAIDPLHSVPPSRWGRLTELRRVALAADPAHPCLAQFVADAAFMFREFGYRSPEAYIHHALGLSDAALAAAGITVPDAPAQHGGDRQSAWAR